MLGSAFNIWSQGSQIDTLLGRYPVIFSTTVEFEELEEEEEKKKREIQ